MMKKHMDLQSFSSPYLTFPFSGAATFLFRHLGDVTPLIVNNNFPILIHFTSLYLGSKLPDILENSSAAQKNSQALIKLSIFRSEKFETT